MHLFTYEPVNGVPEGVLVRDANEILPESSIFQYAGRRSYAAFANWFRYEMLSQAPGFEKDGTFPSNSLIEELKRRYLWHREAQRVTRITRLAGESSLP